MPWWIRRREDKQIREPRVHQVLEIIDHNERLYFAFDGTKSAANYVFWFRENKKSVILLRHSGFQFYRQGIISMG
jgi:hypothetical protein